MDSERRAKLRIAATLDRVTFRNQKSLPSQSERFLVFRKLSREIKVAFDSDFRCFGFAATADAAAFGTGNSR